MHFGVVVLGCGGLGACWVVFVAARGRSSGASLGSNMCAEGHRGQLHSVVCCEGIGGSVSVCVWLVGCLVACMCVCLFVCVCVCLLIGRSLGWFMCLVAC